MTLDTLESLTRELTDALGLSAEDAEAILAQAGSIRAAVDQLDELPLDTVEPAPVFKVVP